MKRFLTVLTLIVLIITTSAQQNLLQYQSFGIGGSDTSLTEVTVSGSELMIHSANKKSDNPIPGTAKHSTFIDYAHDTAFYQLYYSETEKYFSGFSLKNSNEYVFEKSEKIGKYNCKKYTTTLFSNKMEIWICEDLGFRATPTTTFANLPGTVVQIIRNGNYVTNLISIKKVKNIKNLIPSNLGTFLDGRSLNNLEKEKLTITIPVFEDAQICFNPKIIKPTTIPYDTTLSFSNGTVILKRIHVKELPPHYQIFAEVTERSNGDAYDRTGSIFIIPVDKTPNFSNALLEGIEKLPIFTDKNKEEYQGIKLEENYIPLVELVRFFTPFGVHYFNQYRSLHNKDWEDAAYYKQDISDLRDFLKGDVYIGAFIGNYDAGGHKLSLDIKAYPEDREWIIPENPTTWSLPLFNTCNVMEMSGQNYGKLFETDSLTVTFYVPEGISNLRLRYISTGHGGWDTGDEFVPKENTIIIDGKVCFKHTPWRSDCGTYRAFNPASGNFWNGISSSDYSRSGWCPGTATQPVYFNIGNLKPGKHTITVAIPQGAREGNNFSAWCVSGILLGDLK